MSIRSWRPSGRSRWRAFVLALFVVFAGGAGLAQAASPGVVSAKDGQLDLFARSPADGQLLWNRWEQSTGWAGWQGLGGVLHPESDIAAISQNSGNVTVLVRGTDNAVHERQWNAGSGWSGYHRIGGVITGGPAAAAWGDSTKLVFARGTSGSLVQVNWQAGVGWSQWYDLGGVLRAGTGPSVVSRQHSYVDVAVAGTDSRMYVKSYRPDTGWFPFTPQPGTITSTPRAAHVPGQGWHGRIDWTARDGGGSISQYTYDGANFVGWNNLGGAQRENDAPTPIWWKPAPGAAAHFTVFAYALTGEFSQRDWNPSAGWGGYHDLGGERGNLYPTSLRFGGADLRVNTDAEFNALNTAMENAPSVAAAVALGDGLSPSDQARWGGSGTSGTISSEDLAEIPEAERLGVTGGWDAGGPWGGWKFTPRARSVAIARAVVQGRYRAVAKAVCGIAGRTPISKLVCSAVQANAANLDAASRKVLGDSRLCLEARKRTLSTDARIWWVATRC